MSCFSESLDLSIIFLSQFQERAERVAKKKALVDFNSEGKKRFNNMYIFHHRSIVFR